MWIATVWFFVFLPLITFCFTFAKIGTATQSYVLCHTFRSWIMLLWIQKRSSRPWSVVWPSPYPTHQWHRGGKMASYFLDLERKIRVIFMRWLPPLPLFCLHFFTFFLLILNSHIHSRALFASERSGKCQGQAAWGSLCAAKGVAASQTARLPPRSAATHKPQPQHVPINRWVDTHGFERWIDFILYNFTSCFCFFDC